jgi:hypothetical protein
MEAVRTSETSVDNHFTRQYNPENNSEHLFILFAQAAPTFNVLFQIFFLKYYYYYYYYYYHHHHFLSQVFFLPWYFSPWASSEPHHSGFKSQLVALSLWCVMFLVWHYYYYYYYYYYSRLCLPVPVTDHTALLTGTEVIMTRSAHAQLSRHLTAQTNIYRIYAQHEAMRTWSKETNTGAHHVFWTANTCISLLCKPSRNEPSQNHYCGVQTSSKVTQTIPRQCFCTIGLSTWKMLWR